MANWLLIFKLSLHPPVSLSLSSISSAYSARMSSLTHHMAAVRLFIKVNIGKRLELFPSSTFKKTKYHLHSNLEKITCSSTLLHRFFSYIFTLNKSSMGREFCASTMFLQKKYNLAFHLRNWTAYRGLLASCLPHKYI